MSRLDLKIEQIRVPPVSLGARLMVMIDTWRRMRNAARLRDERKRIHADLKRSYVALVDIKARALKSTGVFGTEHENLEQVIVSLAYALEDYRDTI
jgi:hypothetical protein